MAEDTGEVHVLLVGRGGDVELRPLSCRRGEDLLGLVVPEVNCLVLPEADSSFLVVPEAVDELVEGVLSEVQTHDLGLCRWGGIIVVLGSLRLQREPAGGDVDQCHSGGEVEREREERGEGKN